MEAYPGTSPFSLYLKEQFARDPRMGATDRRLLRHYCYCYFRTGKAFSDLSKEEKLITGIWLCTEKADPFLAVIRPEWNELASLSLEEKIVHLHKNFSWDKLFPFHDHLTIGIQNPTWAASLLKQPELFIRIRPDQSQKLLARIQELKLSHCVHHESCVSFPAATNLAALGELDRDYVVQDYSSQRVGELLKLVASAKKDIATKKTFRIWDCCAASGGKSILVADVFDQFELTVSDLRTSMLSQLGKRLSAAGIVADHVLQVDLEKEIPPTRVPSTNLLIADVPCSGSGTWGRTPEQLSFFKEKQIEEYASKQRKIIANSLPFLLPKGYLLYITCSVFKEENEQQVNWLTQEKGLQLIRTELFKGTEMKADTLYAALLQLP